MELEFVFVKALPEPVEPLELVELVDPDELTELPALPLAEVAAAAVDPFVLPVPLPPPPQAANQALAATITTAPIQRWAVRRPI